MKILLDAHISGRTVGKALLEGGHDVRALDSEVEFEGLSDPEVLELAAAEGRVLVTANIRDFEPILKEWAGEGRPRAGVILVPSSVRNEAFGVLISGVEEILGDARQEDYPISAAREAGMGAQELHFFMTEPDERLGGEPPVELLRRGEVERVADLLLSAGQGLS